MSERNARMAALLATDMPPARDPAFEISVLAGIERRRFRRGIIRKAVLAAGAALVLAFIMPQLRLADLSGWGMAWTPLMDNTPVMLALLTAAYAAWRFRPSAQG